MRICRVIKKVPPLVGGMEFHSQYLSRQQGLDGDEVEVFYLFGDLDPPHPNVRVHKAPLSGLLSLVGKDTVVAAVFALLVIPMVWWANWRRPFDVAHLHGDVFEAATGFVFTRILGLPAVMTIHAGLNTKRVYKLMAGPVLRRMPGIIAHSREIGEELGSLGVEPDKVSFSHSGIWMDRFGEVEPDARRIERDRAGISPSEMIVMSVGRLHPMKGYEYVIEAVKILGDSLAGRLVIVGEGPERDQLKEQAAPLGQKVMFMGRREHAEIPSLLTMADIYVLAPVRLGQQRDSTPTALLEAMAYGLPIVTTACGGIKDVVADGVNGFVVPERDAEALAEAIKRLSADPTRRAEMGAHNRKQAAEYDWSHVATMVKRAYLRARASG